MDHILGIYNAVVADTNDPTGAGRVRLQVPQITGATVTGWAHPAGAGSVKSGDNVYMSYAGGDRSYPQFWPVTSTVQSVQGQTGAVTLALQAGSRTAVTGAGTAASPWIVAAQQANLAAVRATGATSTACTAGTLTTMPITTITMQSATGPQFALSGSGVAVPTTGIYACLLETGYGGGTSTTQRTCGTQVNGSTRISGGYQGQGAAAVLWYDLSHLNAGDVVTLLARSTVAENCTFGTLSLICISPDTP